MSGPLRPRTEAFSSLTGRMASQSRRGTGDIRTTVPACAGLRRFYLLCHMQQRSAALHAAGAAYPGEDNHRDVIILLDCSY
ncbi:Transposase (plasmid) [Shigella dysenteriae WRSd3]|uniref:Transposase n=1 Tax=Shigella dysenteriae WRSd3 TaxID=1401327 RepID=A0A090N904_SHIDY|nr:Transposase [Shigella dysenteriae WRSd3]